MNKMETYITKINHLEFRFNQYKESGIFINNIAINILLGFKNDIKSLKIYFTGTDHEGFWNHKTLQAIIEATEDFPLL